MNNTIEHRAQDLPKDQKAYTAEVLTSAAYSEITIEAALDLIQNKFGEQARVDAETLYETFAAW